MVLDVPSSKIDALTGRTDGKVVIKGSIPPEYITAVLPRTKDSNPYHSDGERDILQACMVIDARIKHKTLDAEARSAVLQEIRQREEAQDIAQHSHDVAMIKERRAKKIGEEFRDVRVSKEEVAYVQSQENTDVYTATRRVMYDKLVARFEAAGGRRNSLEEYYTYDSRFDLDTGETIKTYYTRNQVTDDMLKKLRNIVRREEDYAELHRRRDELSKLP